MTTAQTKNPLLLFRRYLIVLVHGLLAAGVYYVAFLLRFEGQIPEIYLDAMFRSLPLVVILKVGAFAAFRLHHGLWRYVSTHDLVRIIKACVLASVALLAGNVLLLQLNAFPRSVYLLDLCGSILAFSGLRLALRLFREHREVRIPSGVRRVRTLIVGAGDAGALTVRALHNGADRRHEIVGFLDDDPEKQGAIIHGAKVHGPIASIPWVVKHMDVDEVLIAMPAAPKGVIRKVVQSCTDTKVQFRILPAISDIMDGSLNVEAIREVQIEDLLGREAVRLDQEAVRAAIGDRTVLITGAAGSIGSELARQIASYGPRDMILLDVAETPLFDIDNELAKVAPEVPRAAVIADIQNTAAIEEVFARHRPHIVFHAAAYKHVPMMEFHPVEAVANNLLGTRNLAEAANRHGVETFVLISTDKAVKPRNIMGASKRAAEMLVTAMSGHHTRFVAVRFGNVLGSSGSVVPTFRRQIAEGGPVTVTHPQATRFFMTIPEAVELVLQASGDTEAGPVFVLDMGAPVKIVDLAQNLIRLSGLTPGEDIDIEYTGLRSGEKLNEELVAYGENLAPTGVAKLSALRRDDSSLAVPEHFWEKVRRLEAAVRSRDGQQVIDLLGELVAETPPAEPSGGIAERDILVNRLQEVLDRSTDGGDVMGNIVGLIKEHTGVEAVGIRAREGEDYPYAETMGFSSDFLAKACSLCRDGATGEVERDDEGKPILAGMCGAVICGRTDPRLPGFTRAGSFWTNSTTDFSTSVAAGDPLPCKPSICHGAGYESVALIPIHSNGGTIALLQLNDRRRNVFTPAMIELYEDIAPTVALALEGQVSDR